MDVYGLGFITLSHGLEHRLWVPPASALASLADHRGTRWTVSSAELRGGGLGPREGVGLAWRYLRIWLEIPFKPHKIPMFDC